jgi:hypothetical protein
MIMPREMSTCVARIMVLAMRALPVVCEGWPRLGAAQDEPTHPVDDEHSP